MLMHSYDVLPFGTWHTMIINELTANKWRVCLSFSIQLFWPIPKRLMNIFEFCSFSLAFFRLHLYMLLSFCTSLSENPSLWPMSAFFCKQSQFVRNFHFKSQIKKTSTKNTYFCVDSWIIVPREGIGWIVHYLAKYPHEKYSFNVIGI